MHLEETVKKTYICILQKTQGLKTHRKTGEIEPYEACNRRRFGEPHGGFGALAHQPG